MPPNPSSDVMPERLWMSQHHARIAKNSGIAMPVSIRQIEEEDIAYAPVCELNQEKMLNAELVEALERTLGRYTNLANSGCAGFWDPEEEEHVIGARAALAKAEAREKGE